MNSINISKRKYENLKQLILPENVVSTEASFYKMNYLNKAKVFKNLHRVNGAVFANKLFTLTMLDEYKEILPESFVIPESFCSVDKEIKGFILPFVKGTPLEAYLKDKKIDIQDQLFYIKKIGDILEQMDHIRNNTSLDSIFLNDLHASNFIVDSKNKDLKVVDLDSCRICDSKPFPARYLTPLSLLNKTPNEKKYDIYKKELQNQEEKSVLEMMTYNEYELYYCRYKNYRDELGYVNSNKESDLYCYVILFLNYLYGSNVGSFELDEFYDYIYYLGAIGFDQNLLNAISLIVTGAPNENIGSYLDSVTNEQVIRAKEKVYKVAKKKYM